MAMRSRYSKEEIARLGEEVFQREIQSKLEGDDPRKFVLIDIESGDYETDLDELAAAARLRARRPDAQVWMRRIGSRLSRRFGSGRRTKPA
jgi:hypothetical protein